MDKLDLTRARKPIMDNWFLAEVRTAIDEVMEFRNLGGGTFVDLTSIGIRRDPQALWLACPTPPVSTSSWARGGT